ncbi:MAG: serine/threonine protein kinase [Anaerovibrio sp.]|uniref:serine/threonine protein kinase n=1 Tax=Anaerovibrio sp. TaxID=1872532 RepID=UPI0025E3280E|nr:serine/threonine-protein kinase [Anaerovibrio sp.]MCR5176910.1 serine/threonine protein kinase [Anaerovibrio sp.]
MSALEFINESFTTVKQLSDNEYGIVYLIKRKKDNMLFIRREYRENKKEIFAKLKEMDIPGIPHILYVLYAGRTIVIEDYIEGISLEKLSAGILTIPNFTITELLKGILPVLREIHSAGIIHRDIKPEHIILGNDMKPYLIDFGIARMNKKHNQYDTEILGTRRYAPPEQFGYQSTDQRSDIYSLGQTLATLLSSIPMSAHEKKIIEKAMSFDPADRYQNAEAMLNALLKTPKRANFIGILVFILLVVAVGGLWYQYAGEQGDKVKTNNAEISTGGESTGALAENSDNKVNSVGQNEANMPLDKGGVAKSGLSQTMDSRPLHVAEGTTRQKTVNINDANVTVIATNTGNQFNVQLSDNKGHASTYSFSYQPPAIHNYDNPNSMEGDIVFMDINGDGNLDIIPILTSVLVKGGNDLVDNTNAWAIVYNPVSGFQRCSGMADSQYLKVENGYLLDEAMTVYTVKNNTFIAKFF